MSVHSQDSDNEELGAIGGNKPISRQVSPFSRPSSVVLMKSLLKQQREHMQQQQRELIQSINSLKDTTLADISRSQTDISARLERLERASPDLNPVELRTNPSDGNFVFHAVPTQVTAPLATRPSITPQSALEFCPIHCPNGRLGQDLGFGEFAFALELPELLNRNLAAVRAKLGQTSSFPNGPQIWFPIGL